MVRQGRLIAVVGAFVIAVLVVGCGAGGPGNDDDDGRGDKRGAVTIKEETTAPEGERSKAQSAHKPVGLEAKVVSPLGQANLPRGFGEGSMWATDFDPSGATRGGYGAAAAARGPIKTLLKRVDPQAGEVVATIPLKGLADSFTQVASGAGSVWVSSDTTDMGPAPKRRPGDVVFRIDPHTNRVVDRMPVDQPSSGLAFGHGSVWVTSASYGTVSRIDPKTDKVVAKIKVGRGAVDIAADESSGAVWVASSYLHKTLGGYDNPKYSEDRNLTRVDPETNRVVEEIPVEAHSQYLGGAEKVAVGEGAVWVLSGDGKLLKVDPATNEIAAKVTVGRRGDVFAHLAVYGGAVWAMVHSTQSRLVRVDPRTMHIVASEDIGSYRKIGEGGWSRAGDTSGSRVGKGWHESRRKTPVAGCVRLTSLPLVSSCLPFGRPSVGSNFLERRTGELRRISHRGSSENAPSPTLGE